MKRAGVGAIVALVLSACGSGPGLSITVEPLAGGVDYKVWLFGAAVSCTGTADVAAGRAVLEAASPCGDAGVDSSACFIQLDVVAVDTPFRFDGVTPGNRTLFGVERDMNENPIGWACGQTTVTSGSASSINLAFQSN
jgi:hypothetical protein